MWSINNKVPVETVYQFELMKKSARISTTSVYDIGSPLSDYVYFMYGEQWHVVWGWMDWQQA